MTDFDGLIDAYEKPIFNLVYRLLGDMDEAADLTQETFVCAYRSFDRFRGDSSPYTWLYRIALNLCKNHFKRKDRTREFEGASLDATGDGAGYDPVEPDTPEAVLERKELKERVEQAISQLPPDYRIVAVLRDLHGLSYKEIAEAAELSEDVVRTRLARARGMLRQKLAAYLLPE